MGMKDRLAQEVTNKLGQDIFKYLESVGAYLELILETNREILNEIREKNGKERLEFEDKEQ